MTLMEAVRARHSVRRYTVRAIEGETLEALRSEIDACVRESGLSIRLRLNRPEAFAGFAATYGLLKGVRNYIVLAGADADGTEERAGYYGERLVLRAQQLGLNTCWVGGTYKKSRVAEELEDGLKLVCVIAVGYGENQGSPRRTKPVGKLCRVDGEMPDWFRQGMEAAQLAPTAVNQQRFLIELKDGRVRACARPGPYSRVDLGIVKYHFEIGAAGADWRWADE